MHEEYFHVIHYKNNNILIFMTVVCRATLHQYKNLLPTMGS